MFRIGGVPEHFNLPWHLAIEQGLFTSENLEVSWTDYPGGTGAMCQDLREGRLDIAILLTEGILAELTRNSHSRLLQVYVSTPLVWGVHVPASSSALNYKDIQSRKYAISRRGSGSHLMAYVDAERQGFPLTEEQMVIAGNLDGARTSFKEQKAEVFYWEKFMTQPYVDNGEFRRVGECPTPWPCFVIAVRNECLQETEALKKISDIIIKSAQAFKQNPEAAAMVAERYGLELHKAKEWLASTEWALDRRIQKGMISSTLDTLKRLSLIENSPEPTALVTELTELYS
jgi:sulfonate transport system substrate-binding protein